MLLFACMIPLLMPIVRAPSYVLWLSYMVFCSCCTMIIHSNHFYSIDGDYDNGWNLEDVEVITLINRWIPTLIPPQLSDHMGFQIIYRSDHLSRYIHALLVFWTDTQATGLYSRLWYLYSLFLSFSDWGILSQNWKDFHDHLIVRGCVAYIWEEGWLFK